MPTICRLIQLTPEQGATLTADPAQLEPLGQVLEHYSFLQSFAAECGAGRTALLLRFEFLADGSV